MSEKKDVKSGAGNTVDSLIKGMENYITTKTVVGEPITIDDTIVLPLADVSFGMGVGQTSKEGAGGGVGGKITPCAVLVIQNGKSRIINVKEEDGLLKLMDMVPEIINKFKGGSEEDETEAE